MTIRIALAALLLLVTALPATAAEEGVLTVTLDPSAPLTIVVDGVQRNVGGIRGLPVRGPAEVCVLPTTAWVVPPCEELPPGRHTIRIEAAGTLHIDGTGQGAVVVDGVVRDTAPIRLPMTVGAVQVQVGAFSPAWLNVWVTEGSVTTVRLPEPEDPATPTTPTTPTADGWVDELEPIEPAPVETPDTVEAPTVEAPDPSPVDAPTVGQPAPVTEPAPPVEIPTVETPDMRPPFGPLPPDMPETPPLWDPPMPTRPDEQPLSDGEGAIIGPPAPPAGEGATIATPDEPAEVTPEPPLMWLDPPLGVFSDVRPGSIHERSIGWLVAQDITRGCAPGRFCPADPVTRAQMASFLARAFDLEPAGPGPGFADVSDASVHGQAILALADAGITTGCAPGLFCPNQPVTRGQMASFLARAFDLPDGAVHFEDVRPGHPHQTSIATLAQAEITFGCAPGRFCPDDPVRRDQMASFLMHGLVRVGGAPPPRPPGVGGAIR